MPSNATHGKEQRVFYLKVNRLSQTTFDCIQSWIDIASRLNAFIYFVCDSRLLEFQILSNNHFVDQISFKFIKSDKRALSHLVQKLFPDNKLWRRIAVAMLTPFSHASNNGIHSFWNIDADDILFLVRPENVARAFEIVERQAIDGNVDCTNYDMFVSKSHGLHWSFGIVFVRDPGKCLATICSNLSFSKHSIEYPYLEKYNFNVDWLFTYFRDSEKLCLRTFYIEKSAVIHMPDIAIRKNWSFILMWNNGYVYQPVLKYLYGCNTCSKLPVSNKVYKIDIELDSSEYQNFLRNFYFPDLSFERDVLRYSCMLSRISAQDAEKYGADM